jgi:hypothetical protein
MKLARTIDTYIYLRPAINLPTQASSYLILKGLAEIGEQIAADKEIIRYDLSWL